ncbi:MAG: adenylate/guanylate cyclase domain-containing protein, partial [Microcoleus sp.]
ESLLLNILPEPIAERLKKAEEGLIADKFEEATVLFADLVNFTQISTTMPATKLVYLLNEIFSTFDRLTEKHGLEKIKTIGDAYMVAAGIPTPRADGAEAIAEMALDMLSAIKELNVKLGTKFDLRIGINSGPVVAGVIGTKKFIYDLWGNAVNTASRMESHGIPGRIQVSIYTYQLLEDIYDFENRGAIEIKGKGAMHTYLLRGRKQTS